VVVSIGHSDATADTVRAAVDLGVTHVTHCWNAHRRFAPRDPGPAGVALVDGRLTIGLIGDLVHVDADVVRATLAAAPGRVAVTTDSIAVSDPVGEVDSDPGVGPARLRGGLLGPLEVLRGLRALGMDWPALVDACSGAAERTVGGPGRGLVPGAVADVVVVDDRTELVRTLVDGVEVARS
jgi:N-acetylglucosamine-6-phosphate deacetylase